MRKKRDKKPCSISLKDSIWLTSIGKMQLSRFSFRHDVLAQSKCLYFEKGYFKHDPEEQRYHLLQTFLEDKTTMNDTDKYPIPHNAGFKKKNEKLTFLTINALQQIRASRN